VFEKSVSHLGFLQFAIQAGDINANLALVKKCLKEQVPPPGSLIALPEMWATGFVYEQLNRLSAEIPALLVEMEDLAQSHGVVLAGSLPMKEGDSLYNKLFFSGLGSPEAHWIAKQHLFSFWQEDQWFSVGDRPSPIDLNGEDIVAGFVCYDLRFPDSVRLQCCQGATIILMSAEWPLARIEHWKVLLRARAIENQAFVVASNACGRWDGLKLGGHSLIIAPDGEILAEAGEAAESVVLPINKEIQKELRQRFNSVAPSPWPADDAEKLMSLNDLVEIVANRKKTGQKIVFTNGCFDILHAGHVDYLQKTRRHGDFLVLGLNDDQSIRSIKGPDRPVNNELQRARVLAALGCVDAVVLFGEDTPLNLITSICPDVLVKGADWEENEIVGAKEVKADGGRVERIAFVSDTSTTGLIDQIKSIE
jgi:rfaE bifunctional protein nucleotidyltransferase chain/domain